MAKPLYYVVLYGKWRSMRPPIWMSFAESMTAFLQNRTVEPLFENYGKAVYGRPSRVKMEIGPHNRLIYWTGESHLFIRSPDGWGLEDWRFEALDAARHCKTEDVAEAPDIFDLILQK